MRRILVACGAVVILSAFASIRFSASAQEQPPQNAAAPVAAANSPDQIQKPRPKFDPSEYRLGIWRDGKAVFSDVMLFDLFLPAEFRRGYQPEQPIHYSHVTHAEMNQIECQYCHSGVNKSPFATIPSVESCMGCHKLVRTDLPEVQLIKKYFEEQKPIEWKPVSNLPQHVFFTHERHVKAGVGCQMCHGQVQRMETVEKVSSFKMGFCVSCHRERGATVDCAACHH